MQLGKYNVEFMLGDFTLTPDIWINKLENKEQILYYGYSDAIVISFLFLEVAISWVE